MEEENPFISIKIRSLFLWLVLVTILVAITQLSILTALSSITNNAIIFNYSDPIYNLISDNRIKESDELPYFVNKSES